MTTKYEQSLSCLINFKATRGWRDMAHNQAARNGMNLTNYIKDLIARDADEDNWRSIADDLYAELRQHQNPIPQTVINALTRYDRQKQNRL